MKKIKLFMLFIAIVLIATACPSETESTGCKKDEDCDLGQVCNTDNGKCEEIITCTPTWCYNDESNKAGNWNKDTKPAKCENNECVVNCPADQEFNEEEDKCKDIVYTCKMIKSVKIVTLAPVLRQGDTKQLKAVALNKNGVATNYDVFAWSGDKDTVATVTDTGLVTGKTETGTANITVTSCGKTAVLPVQNIADLEDGKLRVIVRDIEGGAVSGAKITINNETQNADGVFVTDGNGIFEVANTEAKNTVSVFDTRYQYVTYMDTAKKDLIIYLNQALDMGKSGGYHGEFDFSAETMAGGQIEIGFAGSSLPGSFLDLNFSLLMGENITRHIKISTFEGDYPIPSAMTMKIGENEVTKTYEATALKGERVLWGFGGKLAMSDVMPLVQQAMGEGGISLGPLLAKITPMFQSFHFTTKDNFDVKWCDKIVDTADYDNDGNNKDYISDFKNETCFPKVDMKLDQPLSEKTTVKFPDLPTMKTCDKNGENCVDKFTEFAAVMIGSDVPKKGYVPTGMGGGADLTEDEAETDIDGKVIDTEVIYAPKTEGLVASPSTALVLTMPLQEGGGDDISKGQIPPVRMSGIIKYFDDGVVPSTLDYSSENFIALAEDATYDRVNGKIEASDIANANVYRLQLIDTNGVKWVVFSPSPVIELPMVGAQFNMGGASVLETLMYQALKLDVSYEELVEFNNTNIDDFTKLMKSFSLYEIMDEIPSDK